MRTRFAADINSPRTSVRDDINSAPTAHMDDVQTTTGFACKLESQTDGFEFGLDRARFKIISDRSLFRQRFARASIVA